MNGANKAVFLSYASQDAEAAKKICDALRAAGVEVWFDQNELRGGDAWDSKIKRQIRECALFLPVISAHTSARLEGYFRREWKLAVDRTHDMAEEKAFLVPVVIDGTTDAAASVPEKFREVQWTRLPGGETPVAFGERVKYLLGGSEMEAGRPRPARRDEGVASPVNQRVGRRVAAAAWAFAGVAAFVVIGLLWQRRTEPMTPFNAGAGTRPPTTEKAAPAVVAPQTDVQKLLAQIWKIYELQEDGTLEEWTLAEDLGAQAVKLEPTNAEAWAAYAQASWGVNFLYTSSTRTTREEAMRRAERALALAPESDEARFAQANLLRVDPSTRPQAEAMLRELLQRRPNDKRVLRVLAYAIRNRITPDSPDELVDEALGYLDRAAALPGGDASALTGKISVLAVMGRYEEALAAAEASVALRNGPGALNWKIGLLLYLKGDPEKAGDALNTVPAAFWRQDRNIVLASRVLQARQQSRAALTMLARLPDDWVTGFQIFIGPKGLLTGEAHRLAGNPEAAQTDWRAALQVVNRRLATTPNNPVLLYWKTWLHVALGERAEAQRVFLLWQQFSGNNGRATFTGGGTLGGNTPAELYLQLGERNAVLEALEARVKRLSDQKQRDTALIFRNRLRFESTWDALRGEPQFEAALVQLAEVGREATPAMKGKP